MMIRDSGLLFWGHPVIELTIPANWLSDRSVILSSWDQPLQLYHGLGLVSVTPSLTLATRRDRFIEK